MMASGHAAAGVPRPVSPEEQAGLADFIRAAPAMARAAHAGHGADGPEGALARYRLPATLEHIHCVLWEGQYLMTSCDIIKVLRVLVRAGGHGQADRKFKESVFSALRRYRPGLECQVELAHSRLLLWLQQHGCIRTIKRQRMYYWHKVDVFGLADEIRQRAVRRPALDYIAALRPAPSRLPSPALARPNTSTLDSSALLCLAEVALRLEAESRHTAVLLSQPPSSPAARAAVSPVQALLANLAIGQSHAPGYPALAGSLHTDDSRRRYACAECGSRFIRSEHMKRHQKTHSEDPQYACPYEGCDRRYTRQDNLDVHFRKHSIAFPVEKRTSPC